MDAVLRAEISRAQRLLGRLSPRDLVTLLLAVGDDGHYSRVAAALMRCELRSREWTALSSAASTAPTGVA